MPFILPAALTEDWKCRCSMINCLGGRLGRSRYVPGSRSEAVSASPDAGFTVRADELVAVLVGDDRGDAGHGQNRERRGDLDEPVGYRLLVPLRDGDVAGQGDRHELAALGAGPLAW